MFTWNRLVWFGWSWFEASIVSRLQWWKVAKLIYCILIAYYKFILHYSSIPRLSEGNILLMGVKATEGNVF